MAKPKQTTRRNQDIQASEIRVIGPDGEQIGVMSRDEGLQIATERDLDLVEIVPNAEPPVCRVMDYGKFKFEQAKKAQTAKKKQKQVQLKEIKFRPGTEEGDYNTKLKKVHYFLEHGDKVKLTVRFRGREMAHQDVGRRLLDRVQEDIAEEAQIEQTPRMEGRTMTMLVAPKRK